MTHAIHWKIRQAEGLDTALPLNTIRHSACEMESMAMTISSCTPFEARGSGEAAIASTEAYGYTAWDGYINDQQHDGSLGMPNSFNALTIAGLSDQHPKCGCPSCNSNPQQVEAYLEMSPQ